MKKYYTLIALVLISTISYTQTYQLGLQHNSGYNFTVVAIPSTNSSGNTDIFEIGFTLMLPSGTVDVTSQIDLLGGRTWNVNEFDATFLTGQGLGDGTLDAFQFNMPPGQTLISHNTDAIDLVSFDVSNMPTTGSIAFLLNNDSIAIGAGGVLNSFYNVDLDGSGGMPTADYFSGLVPGLESFMFSTLNIEETELSLAKISIYPNPASKVITIDSTLAIDRVELFDMLGKRVLQATNTKNIQVDQLPSGLYMVKVYAKNSSITKRIVIE